MDADAVKKLIYETQRTTYLAEYHGTQFNLASRWLQHNATILTLPRQIGKSTALYEFGIELAEDCSSLKVLLLQPYRSLPPQRINLLEPGMTPEFSHTHLHNFVYKHIDPHWPVANPGHAYHDYFRGIDYKQTHLLIDEFMMYSSSRLRNMLDFPWASVTMIGSLMV